PRRHPPASRSLRPRRPAADAARADARRGRTADGRDAAPAGRTRDHDRRAGRADRTRPQDAGRTEDPRSLTRPDGGDPTMPSYAAPSRDLQFVLDEVLEVSKSDVPGYGDLEPGFTSAILDEAGRLARDVLAPLNASGDREGCRLE